MYISFPFYVVVYLNSNQLQQKRIADKKKYKHSKKYNVFFFLFLFCFCGVSNLHLRDYWRYHVDLSAIGPNSLINKAWFCQFYTMGILKGLKYVRVDDNTFLLSKIPL